MADRETAGGDIGLIQAFVNTVDLQDGPDELSDPNTLKAWLVANDLMDGSQPVEASDLRHAIALREAIRGAIGPNSGQQVYPVDIATLNGAATASGLRMRFGADGKPRMEPEAPGVVGAMGRIVATLYAAMEDASWSRLKLCRAKQCRWAFYDRSKNHSSRWCTMASCGNREKARRFRSHKAHS
ncbi:MAG: CGNR zinc finger domain-containing protein [Candidatus Dormibacteraceae bacterium]